MEQVTETLRHATNISTQVPLCLTTAPSHRWLSNLSTDPLQVLREQAVDYLIRIVDKPPQNFQEYLGVYIFSLQPKQLFYVNEQGHHYPVNVTDINKFNNNLKSCNNGNELTAGQTFFLPPKICWEFITENGDHIPVEWPIQAVNGKNNLFITPAVPYAKHWWEQGNDKWGKIKAALQDSLLGFLYREADIYITVGHLPLSAQDSNSLKTLETGQQVRYQVRSVTVNSSNLTCRGLVV